jgi:hypothetical protein
MQPVTVGAAVVEGDDELVAGPAAVAGVALTSLGWVAAEAWFVAGERITSEPVGGIHGREAAFGGPAPLAVGAGWQVVGDPPPDLVCRVLIERVTPRSGRCARPVLLHVSAPADAVEQVILAGSVRITVRTDRKRVDITGGSSRCLWWAGRLGAAHWQGGRAELGRSAMGAARA